MLELKGVHAKYGLAEVLFGVDFKVPDKSIIGLIGPNGAGKSTTILSICGLHPVMQGEILFNGQPINPPTPQEIKNQGISTIPEGRRLFAKMTVTDNLLMGAYICRDRTRVKVNLSEVFSLFPILEKRKHQLSGSLSGGEQQMLAIGRALMAEPVLLLADEISLGLAPIVIQEVYKAIQSTNAKGVSILVVEQQASITFKFTSYIYVMELGKITIEGLPKDLMNNQYIQQTYLGE